MGKSTRNTGKPWTSADKSALSHLASQNTPTRVIGLKGTPGNSKSPTKLIKEWRGAER